MVPWCLTYGLFEASGIGKPKGILVFKFSFFLIGFGFGFRVFGGPRGWGEEVDVAGGGCKWDVVGMFDGRGRRMGGEGFLGNADGEGCVVFVGNAASFFVSSGYTMGACSSLWSVFRGGRWSDRQAAQNLDSALRVGLLHALLLGGFLGGSEGLVLLHFGDIGGVVDVP